MDNNTNNNSNNNTHGNATLNTLMEGLNAAVPEQLSNARLLKIEYSERTNVLDMFLRSEQLVPYAVTAGFQRDMRKSMGLADCLLHLKYTPDMLCADYFPELTEYLKVNFPTVNGFFDGAEAVYENDTFTVSLKHGGANDDDMVNGVGCVKHERKTDRNGVVVGLTVKTFVKCQWLLVTW